MNIVGTFRSQHVAPREKTAREPLLAHKTRSTPLRPCVTGSSTLGDAFLAEYQLAGLQLDAEARKQLRDWYSGTAAGVRSERPQPDGATHFKPLPQLPPASAEPNALTSHSSIAPPAPRALTLVWDLESVKPFTQQHKQPTQEQDQSLSPTNRPSPVPSRLSAAGLSESAPDLPGALDQLCRTLREYGTVHAVHLVVRQATLDRVPALHRQLDQLLTWAPQLPQLLPQPAEGADAASGAAGRVDTGAGAQAASLMPHAAVPASGSPLASALAAAEAAAAAAANGAGSGDGGGETLNARRRGRYAQSAAPHRGRGQGQGQGQGHADAVQEQQLSLPHACPLCTQRSATRLQLLQHFAQQHQGPVLQATCVNPRMRILWTRGRAVKLGVPRGRRAGGAEGQEQGTDQTQGQGQQTFEEDDDDQEGKGAGSGSEETRETNGVGDIEWQVLSPQDFVWGREKLLGLRHLDQLLAAAPVHVHVAAAGSRPTSNARPPPASRPPPPHAATQLPSPALCTPGLHVHVVPRGRAVEAAAEELAGLAEALVKAWSGGSAQSSEDATAAATSSQARRSGEGSGAGAGSGNGGGNPEGRQQQGQQAKGQAQQQEAGLQEGGAPCLCVVGDVVNALEQAGATCRRAGVHVLAVTRTARLSNVDAALRWWAVQGDEYELMWERGAGQWGSAGGTGRGPGAGGRVAGAKRAAELLGPRTGLEAWNR